MSLEEHRKLLLVIGMAGIIPGILIWSNWPFDSLSLLGQLVGINLILSGVSIVKIVGADQLPSRRPVQNQQPNL